MTDSPQSAARPWNVFKIDLTADSPERRSLDCLIPLSECAAEMRRRGEDRTIPVAALEGVIEAFGRMDVGGGLSLLALTAADIFYRSICRLTILDRSTRTYVKVVGNYYFRNLSERGARCFYVVDNSIRDDRFHGIVELFGLAGFAVVSPHLDNVGWPDLEARLHQCVADKRHIFYVEKDTSVNFLDAVKALATNSGMAAGFRGESSDTPAIEILAT